NPVARFEKRVQMLKTGVSLLIKLAVVDFNPIEQQFGPIFLFKLINYKSDLPEANLTYIEAAQ
ncbi:MAG: hypothetical protein K9K64_07895, partial [Desulfohalobiaceae bacterium]|nr:hypothetical protein [Desulfohalobiaceae bacterium]